MPSLLLSLVVACSTQSQPSSLDACHGMDASPQRDECYADFLPELFLTDPPRAAELVQHGIEDSLVRDFVYLQVTRDLDPAGGRWCERISSTTVAERCRVLARRPHLQRARLGRDADTPPAPGAPEPSEP